MRNVTIYLTLFLCLFLNRIMAQETFEGRARAIANKIEQITKEEKAALKTEIEEVNQQLQNGALTTEQADEKKIELAEKRANAIETRTAGAQEELKNLVQQKVDGNITERDSTGRYSVAIASPIWIFRKDHDSISGGEQRTTSQLVIAGGFNNLVTDGALANSDFGYARSAFWEWGLTLNTRLMKENNLLHLKYGFSWMYNMLTPTDNRYFVENGDQTVLATYPTHLRKKDTYFKNVYVTIPVHLEFDFTKKEVRDGKSYFRTHQGFRFGIGGYAGYNTNSKQFLSYREDGHRINERQKGGWNVNDWNYGVSAYIGHGELSLYAKYDLSPMFKDNPIKQNNISLGVRMDLN